MRRFIEIVTPLSEAWIGTANPYQNHETNIYIDPSRAEIAKIMREVSRANGNDPEPMLRLWLGTHLYVWDANAFVHHDFPRNLLEPEDRAISQGHKMKSGFVPLIYDRRGLTVPTANYLSDDHEVADPLFDEHKALVEAHPLILRAFGPVILRDADPAD